MGDHPGPNPSRRSAVRLLADRLRGVYESDEPAIHPFRPRSREEVPDAAWRDLVAIEPELRVDRLFVVPPAMVRKRGATIPHAVTPWRVLAFGDCAVALWTLDGGVASIATMPIAELMAVDDRIILLYGRLTLIGARGRIVVHYNTVSRDSLRENVRWLRSRLTSAPNATANSFVWVRSRGASGSQADLPYKWWYILTCDPNLRLDPTEPAMVAVGDVVEEFGGRRRRRRRASGIAILGPRELVVATEPFEHLEHSRHGVDLTTVPRRSVRDLCWDGRVLRIGLQTADGLPAESIVRPVERHLVEAMRESFGSALPWS